MEDKTFFYPYCCHVCKKWDVKLDSCSRCRMISYCTIEHQQEHWPQHKEICKATTRVLENMNTEYMNTEEISFVKWRKIRKKYIKKVSVILERVLKNEEIQMFQFPKACVVCHRQDRITRCKRCPSAAFCDKHRDDSEHREKYCKFLRRSFKMYKYLNLTGDIDMSFVNRLSNETRFDNMYSFLNTYLPLDDVYLRMSHSNLFTYPLTVYYCIKKLEYLRCETLNVHIIGRHVIRRQDEIEVWKMLLILIPSLTTLTITFIQNKEHFSNCNISTEVVWQTKKLVANVRYMLYEKYMGTTEFKKPNFIVGFDARVKDNRFATEKCVDICALAPQMCPYILIFEYIYSYEKEMLHKIKKCFFGKNPYPNLMLYRTFATEDPYRPYSYLIIFNDLDSSKVFIRRNQCILPKTTRD